MGDKYKVKDNGTIVPVKLAADPANPDEAEFYYNTIAKLFRFFNGTIYKDIQAAGVGEANTASNQGAGGVGVFLTKNGVDLEFKNINAGSSKISVTNDGPNKEVDLDVVEANIIHQNLSGAGTNTHAQLDVHVGDATIHFTEASIDHTAIQNIGTNTHAQIDTHIADAANPHAVTAAQVGNGTAQWNADKLQGVDVSAVAPTDNQVLTFDAAGNKWQAETPAAGGGGLILDSSNNATGITAGTFVTITPGAVKKRWRLNLKIKATTSGTATIQVRVNGLSTNIYDLSRVTNGGVYTFDNNTAQWSIASLNITNEIRSIGLEFSTESNAALFSVTPIGCFNDTGGAGETLAMFMILTVLMTTISFTLSGSDFDYEWELFNYEEVAP